MAYFAVQKAQISSIALALFMGQCALRIAREDHIVLAGERPVYPKIRWTMKRYLDEP
jgi:hypothetical protein